MSCQYMFPNKFPFKRAVILGAAGQLGRALCKSLDGLVEVAAFDLVTPIDMPFVKPLDVSDPSLAATLRQLKPDVLFNAAAYTLVDKAETETELNKKLNDIVPAQLAEIAAEIGSTYLHFSTDYVFDGSGTKPWVETDPTGALGAYGRAKASGERKILEVAVQAAIIRTSWVVSASGNNFVKTMLRLGAERDELRIVADQRGAPTSAAWLSEASLGVATWLKQQNVRRPEIFHCACAGETSWHEFACYVFDQARAKGWSLKVRNVEPIATAEYPTPARRPLNSRLNCTKLAGILQRPGPDWRTEVSRILDELQQAAP
jgi:dTDP-4-dehydrorhamnose reductase